MRCEITLHKFHCLYCKKFLDITPDFQRVKIRGKHKLEILIDVESIYRDVSEFSYLPDPSKYLDVCHECYIYIKQINYKYKKNKLYKKHLEKEYVKYLKYQVIDSIYNQFFYKHLQLSKIIEIELIEYLYHPNKILKYLENNDEIENYLH